MHAIWMTADRDEKNEKKSNDQPPKKQQEQNLAQVLRPYATASIDGEYRLGFRAHF